MTGPIGDKQAYLHTQVGYPYTEEVTDNTATKVQTEPGLAGVKDSIARAKAVQTGEPYYANAFPNNPVLPPGISEVPLSEVLASASSGSKDVLQQLYDALPEALQEKANLPAHVAGPLITGMKEGLLDVAGVTSTAKQYLAGVEATPPPPSIGEQIAALSAAEPGPIDPKTSPTQKNTQMFINAIDASNNASQVAKAEVAAMPDGAGKDSYSAFLQRIDVVLTELRQVLGQIQQGAGSSGKEKMGKSSITEVSDWNVSLHKKLEEMKEARKKKTNFLSDLFGTLADFLDLPVLRYLTPINIVIDILPEELDFVGGFLEMFTTAGLLKMGQGMAEGQFVNGILNGDFSVLETMITDFIENPEMMVAGAVTFVLVSSALIFLGPMGMGIALFLALTVAGMVGGRKTMLGDMVNRTPLLGDLLGDKGLGGFLGDILDPLMSAIGLNKLLGNPEPGEDAVKERIEARKAAMTSTDARARSIAAKHRAEDEGIEEEDADLIAAIQKLIQLLTSIKGGNTNPSLMAGDIEAAIKTIMNADMKGLEGAEGFTDQLKDASKAIGDGDYDKMLDELSGAFTDLGVDLEEDSIKKAQKKADENFAPITSQSAKADPEIAFREFNNPA